MANNIKCMVCGRKINLRKSLSCGGVRFVDCARGGCGAYEVYYKVIDGCVMINSETIDVESYSVSWFAKTNTTDIYKTDSGEHLCTVPGRLSYVKDWDKYVENMIVIA